MKTLYALGGLLMVLTTSCAPILQLNVKPAQATDQWAEGREQAVGAADSVETRLSFVCYEPSRLVFEAEYRNLSRRAVVVAPEAISCAPSRENKLPVLSGTRVVKPAFGQQLSATQAAAVWPSAQAVAPLPAAPLPAFDPEPEIRQLTENAEALARRAARIDWLGVALSVTSVVADVASIGQRETVSQVQSRAALSDIALTYNVASAANKVQQAVTADVLHARAMNLQEYALRKVTLAPGQQVRGYVYLPRFDTADGLLLRLPVRDNAAVLLPFAQTRQR